MDKIIDEPIHISDKDFEEKVLNSDLPVIVDFWAVWCGPCKMIAPMLIKIAKEYAGKLVIAKIDVDINTKWTVKYGVQGIPTSLFFFKGKVAYRQVGALPEKMFRTIVTQFLDITTK